MSLDTDQNDPDETVTIDRVEAALEHEIRAIADIRLRVNRDGLVTEASLARPRDLDAGEAMETVDPIGRSIADLLGQLVPGISAMIDHAYTTGQAQPFSFMSADGERWLSGRMAASPNGDVLIAARDITPEHTLQRQLEFQAFHDPLTNLPNRLGFQRALDDMLGRRPLQGAVLIIDLDEFKLVNDVAGHKAGDELLTKIAGRLRDNCRAYDSPARLGGDEFAVLLRDVSSRDHAMAAANHLHEALRQPLTVGDELSVQRCSIGVTQLHVGDTPNDVMRRADVALIAAKSEGKNTIANYDSELYETMKQRHGLVRDLEAAITEGEIHVVYQPIVELTSGRVTAVETLARWTTKAGQEVSPTVFVRAAEEHGLISALFDHMLATALTDAADWIRERPSLQLHVNLSPLQMRDAHLSDVVTRHLATAHMPATNLSVEITESVLALDSPAVRGNLDALKSLGVSICLDDFGTGYSSLAYLQQFAPSSLKLDRSFVEEMSTSGDARLPRAILGLARELDIEAVAEGIETEDEWLQLRDLGWRYGQGFLMARPAAATEVERMLDQHLLPTEPN